MREQKSWANWLNTENARCHRTVYITMQNVTSKVQIGLSPEMGWYPVSFTIIVKKMSGCVHQFAVHEHCSKTVRDRFVLAYTPGVLRVFVLTAFHALSLVLFPLLHYPLPHFQCPHIMKWYRDDLVDIPELSHEPWWSVTWSRLDTKLREHWNVDRHIARWSIIVSVTSYSLRWRLRNRSTPDRQPIWLQRRRLYFLSTVTWAQLEQISRSTSRIKLLTIITVIIFDCCM